MTEKNKTDPTSALVQYNALDTNAQYLLSSFLQMAAAMILNIKQMKPDTAQEVQSND